MNESQSNFLRAVRVLVSGSGELLGLSTDWEAVSALARRNHLETVAYRAASSAGAPEEVLRGLKVDHARMLARDARQFDALAAIESALRGAGVHYAPLKGAILCRDYPSTSMRFMSDLDFYVRPQDRRAIRGGRRFARHEVHVHRLGR